MNHADDEPTESSISSLGQLEMARAVSGSSVGSGNSIDHHTLPSIQSVAMMKARFLEAAKKARAQLTKEQRRVNALSEDQTDISKYIRSETVISRPRTTVSADMVNPLDSSILEQFDASGSSLNADGSLSSTDRPKPLKMGRFAGPGRGSDGRPSLAAFGRRASSGSLDQFSSHSRATSAHSIDNGSRHGGSRRPSLADFGRRASMGSLHNYSSHDISMRPGTLEFNDGRYVSSSDEEDEEKEKKQETASADTAEQQETSKTYRPDFAMRGGLTFDDGRESVHREEEDKQNTDNNGGAGGDVNNNQDNAATTSGNYRPDFSMRGGLTFDDGRESVHRDGENNISNNKASDDCGGDDNRGTSSGNSHRPDFSMRGGLTFEDGRESVHRDDPPRSQRTTAATTGKKSGRPKYGRRASVGSGPSYSNHDTSMRPGDLRFDDGREPVIDSEGGDMLSMVSGHSRDSRSSRKGSRANRRASMGSAPSYSNHDTSMRPGSMQFDDGRESIRENKCSTSQRDMSMRPTDLSFFDGRESVDDENKRSNDAAAGDDDQGNSSRNHRPDFSMRGGSTFDDGRESIHHDDPRSGGTMARKKSARSKYGRRASVGSNPSYSNHDTSMRPGSLQFDDGREPVDRKSDEVTTSGHSSGSMKARSRQSRRASVGSVPSYSNHDTSMRPGTLEFHDGREPVDKDDSDQEAQPAPANKEQQQSGPARSRPGLVRGRSFDESDLPNIALPVQQITKHRARSFHEDDDDGVEFAEDSEHDDEDDDDDYDDEYEDMEDDEEDSEGRDRDDDDDDDDDRHHRNFMSMRPGAMRGISFDQSSSPFGSRPPLLQKSEDEMIEEEKEAMEGLASLLEKEQEGAGPDQTLKGLDFSSLQRRYLAAIDHLRPKQLEIPKGSNEAVGGHQHEAVKRHLMDEKIKKDKYVAIRKAWDKYLDSARDKPALPTTEEKQVQEQIEKVEEEVVEQWVEYAEKVNDIVVATEPSTPQSKKKSKLHDEDSDDDDEDTIKQYLAEARQLKEEALARKKAMKEKAELEEKQRRAAMYEQQQQKPRRGGKRPVKAEEVTDKEEKSKLADLLDDKAFDDLLLSPASKQPAHKMGFSQLQRKYLNVMGKLLPEQVEPTKIATSSDEQENEIKEHFEKEKVKKDKYVNISGAWDKYEVVAVDRPSEPTAEDKKIEEEIEKRENQVAEKWVDYATKIADVVTDTRKKKKKKDVAGEGVENDGDDDLPDWVIEARKMKEIAVARAKAREEKKKEKERVLKERLLREAELRSKIEAKAEEAREAAQAAAVEEAVNNESPSNVAQKKKRDPKAFLEDSEDDDDFSDGESHLRRLREARRGKKKPQKKEEHEKEATTLSNPQEEDTRPSMDRRQASLSKRRSESNVLVEEESGEPRFLTKRRSKREGEDNDADSDLGQRSTTRRKPKRDGDDNGAGNERGQRLMTKRRSKRDEEDKKKPKEVDSDDMKKKKKKKKKNEEEEATEVGGDDAKKKKHRKKQEQGKHEENDKGEEVKKKGKKKKKNDKKDQDEDKDDDGNKWKNPFVAWYNGPPRKFKISGTEIIMKVPPKTDCWRKTRHNFIMDNAPFYFQKVSGDFEVIVNVSGSFTTMYDKAGIMVRLDEKNWILTGMEFFNGRVNHSTSLTVDHTDWSLAPLPKDAEKVGVWFCLKRIGDCYETFYSFDGRKWNQTRQGLFTTKPSLHVGICAACPMGNEFKVVFDYYKCSAWKG